MNGAMTTASEAPVGAAPHSRGFEAVMATIARLNASTEALAALGACLRIEAEGVGTDPGIRAALDRILASHAIDLRALDEAQIRTALTAVHGFFEQSAALLRDPGRSPGWDSTDPAVLVSQGDTSVAIAGLIRAIAPHLDGLEAALARQDGAFLDIGSGVGALAIALCRQWPSLRVVGLEPWEPAMSLAADRVASSGVAKRIELRRIGIEDLGDVAAFDAIWLPSPFIDPGVIPEAVRRASRALRPGGWLLFGVYRKGPDQGPGQALLDLRTVRCGGRPFLFPEVHHLLGQAGLEHVSTIEGSWAAPVAFVVGRREERLP